MQIILKTGLCSLLVLLSVNLEAGESEVQETEPTTGLMRDAGHVEGYLTLPVGEDEVAATFVGDKQGSARGKILILHGRNGGIDSHGLVNRLRLALAESGWTTMTIALDYPVSPELYLFPSAASAEAATDAPISPDTADVEPQADEQNADIEAVEQQDNNQARIGTALAYLNAQQPGPTVVIAHGEATSLTDIVAAQLGDKPGLVWLQSQLTPAEAPAISPLLDIAGQDPGRANKHAESRRVMMRQQQAEGYSQRLITGAGYDFYGFENQVLGYVRGWLYKHFVEEARS